MKRYSVTKALAKRRRRNRLRRLKQAALTVGLATAWGAAAEGAATFSVTSTLNVDVSHGVTLFNDAASATITLTRGAPGPLSLPSPSSRTRIIVEDQDAATLDETDFIFAAVIDNGSGPPDIVLSFPNGGDGIVGQPWTSLFVDNQAVPAREPFLIPELEAGPFNDTSEVAPGSELEALLGFQDLMNTPVGETATLIAFTGAANTGQIIGAITYTAVPEPVSTALVAVAGGVVFVSRRRLRE